VSALPDAAARHPSLQALLDVQGGVVTTAQLREILGKEGLRRAIRRQVWIPVHRGAYCPRSLGDAAGSDARLEHRLQCASRLAVSSHDLVISHGSAALLHGLTMLDDHRGPPELTLVRPPGTPLAHVRGWHAAGLPPDHRQQLHGLPVTTRARTVADLARRLPRPAGVVLADAALRDGVDRAAVLNVLSRCTGWPGTATAIATVLFADGRAESVLESLARVWLADAGLPAPDLQARFCEPADGRFVARVDFFWPQHRTVCEVDGRAKYKEAAEPPQRSTDDEPGDAVWREKVREDALRDFGLEVVRGYWSDGRDGGGALAARVRRAFDRAALRADTPSYGLLRAPLTVASRTPEPGSGPLRA
jgi:hypothetical protein